MSDVVILTSGEDTSDESPFRCEVCGTALVYSGRGRHPVRCDEHKKGASAGVRGGGSNAGLERIRVGLTELYTTLAFGLGTFGGMMGENEQGIALSMDAQIVAANASKMADSWVDLARNDPKVRKALEKMLTGSGWGKVIMAHGFVGVAIAANHGVRVPMPSMSTNGSV